MSPRPWQATPEHRFGRCPWHCGFWAGLFGAVGEGAVLVEQALALNPNFAWGSGFSGWTNNFLGKLEVAREQLARALRLSPHDPLMLSYHAAMACAVEAHQVRFWHEADLPLGRRSVR